MSQIGKAYIEIIADLKKFPADLRTKLKAALKEGMTGVEFTGLEDKAKVAGEHAAEDLGKGFEKKASARLKQAGESGGRSLLGGLRKIFSRNSSESGGFFGSLAGFFGGIASSVQDAVSAAGSSAASAGSSALSKLGGLFSGGDIMGTLKTTAFAVLIPTAIALAGALYQLGGALFALPAAAGVGIAAIAPLMIAFQGVGEAIGAGMSGNVQKFNAALKGLAEPAQTVVREIVGLKSQFTAIKKDVQSAFFAPMIGEFRVLGRTLLPVLRGGLADVADSLGRFVSGLLDILAGKEALVVMKDLFAATARIINIMGPSVQNVFGMMLGLIKTGLPFVERFFGWVARGIDSFAAWLEKAQKGGKVTSWLERAADIGKKLWDVLKEVGKFVGTVLNSVGDEGTDTIRGMADAFKELNVYLQSPEGEKFLHNLGVLLHWAGNAVVFFIRALKGSFWAVNVTFNAVRWLAKALHGLGSAVWSAIKTVGAFFVAVWDWLKGAGKAIADFFTKTIPDQFGKLVQWFKDLPGQIGKGLDEGRQSLADWFVNLLKSWYEGVLRQIGQVIGVFLALPQTIPAALSALGDTLSTAWNTAWEFAKQAVVTGWNNVLAFFMGIPGALAAAGEGIWAWASDLWTRVWNTTTDLVTSGVNKVIDFFTGIPGRIKALGPAILEAARSIGHKIAEGLSQIGDFASDLGKKVTNALKDGINWVIDSINRGIADVDDAIPGDLPRIPRLAKGARVDSPTLALIGEAGPEVVIPLNNQPRARELAQQSGLLGMLAKGSGGANVTVIAYLDGTGAMIPVARTVVRDELDQQGTEYDHARAA